MLELRERVRKEEEKGVTAAAALFLDAMLLLEAEGWLRGFLDALAAAGGCHSRAGFCPLPPALSGSWAEPPGDPGTRRALRRPWAQLPVLSHRVRCRRKR